MIDVRLPVFCAAASLVLCACASLGGGGDSSAGSGEPEYGGIQTRSIRSAPQTQQSQNDSRPLSELNTPDAIAAREAAPRPARGKVAAASVAGQSQPGATAVAAPAASAQHQQIAGLQKGAKVRLRDGATLHARPAQSSDVVPSSAGAELELGPQIYNASGYWWYATAGKDAGWLSQTDLVR